MHTHTHAETQISSLALSGTTLFSTKAMQTRACAHTHAQTSSLTLSGTTSSSTKAVQTHTCTQMRTHTHTHTHTHKPPVWHWAGPLHPRQQPCVFSPVTSANSHKCSSWIKKNWFLHCKRTYFPGKDQIMMTVMFSSSLQKPVITTTTTNSQSAGILMESSVFNSVSSTVRKCSKLPIHF